MLKKLKPNFYFSFSRHIWNVITNPQGSVMILELREENSITTSFAAIDLKKNQLKWDHFQLDQNNWAGLTALDDNILILHTFNDSENPEDKSYFAIDIEKQKIIWKKSKMQILGVYERALWGIDKTSQNQNEYQKINLDNGKISTADNNEIPEGFNTGYENNNSLLLPYHYQQGSDYFNTASWFLNTYMGVTPVLGLDYLEYYHLIIISFYIYENKALTNYLMVFNQEGDPELKEKIGADLEGIGMDTFLMVNNNLVLIKDKSQLLGYAL